ncbi:hypothetical protein OAI01_07635, partial [Alphaproteobacteria bacterium]|nr:hypothetical protein [Alphaproteobacteria bacterium]
MIYLIKFCFFIIFSFKVSAINVEKNEIIFKLENKVFTIIDLERRVEYISYINNIETSEFNEIQKKEILNDYVSALIFYEYYLKNKIIFNNLNDEVNTIYITKIKFEKKINKQKIRNIKFNINIDLIRKKIIEDFLNKQKNDLYKNMDNIELLYNYNISYIIINQNLINETKLSEVNDRQSFDQLVERLSSRNINFFLKQVEIDNYSSASTEIKEIINKNLKIKKTIENNFIKLISLEKNFESYNGIFVKLINFSSKNIIKSEELTCKKLENSENSNTIIYKEYEYSKLNKKIKNNLKSINDYIVVNDGTNYDYIVLCDLKYDKSLMQQVSFNKNVNSLVSIIQENFLKKYKNKYN